MFVWILAVGLAGFIGVLLMTLAFIEANKGIEDGNCKCDEFGSWYGGELLPGEVRESGKFYDESETPRLDSVSRVYCGPSGK